MLISATYYTAATCCYHFAIRRECEWENRRVGDIFQCEMSTISYYSYYRIFFVLLLLLSEAGNIDNVVMVLIYLFLFYFFIILLWEFLRNLSYQSSNGCLYTPKQKNKKKLWFPLPCDIRFFRYSHPKSLDKVLSWVF